MIAIEQRKVSIIRVFEDGKKYGDKWVFNVVASYYGKYSDVVVIEGLTENISLKGITAMRKLLLSHGVKEVKWDHTNEHGHKKHMCLDIVNNNMRYE